MKVTFSAAMKGNEYKRSLTKTLAGKSLHVSMSGNTPKDQALPSLAYLTRYRAILKFEDCCFKDYYSVKLKCHLMYGKNRVA